MSDPTPDTGDGGAAERARIVAYLAFHERSARTKATAATSDESRIYQTTIANAMQAMREAIEGGFHWKADL